MRPRQKCLGNRTRVWSNNITCGHFNEAETKMSRKCTADALSRVGSSLTSMRPRQKCLGNHMAFHTICNRHTTSMRPRQKCLGNCHPYRPSHPVDHDFNEAETKMSRKSAGQDGMDGAVGPLQWGRDKNVSEIGISIHVFAVGESTSMRPRQKCLGNLTHRTHPRIDNSHFNEAETKMSRKSYALPMTSRDR